MQMNARWKVLPGRPYQLCLLAALAPNTEFLPVFQYPLLIQGVLCRHVCLIQVAGQGCVAGSSQVGVNLDFDKSSYIDHIQIIQ